MKSCPSCQNSYPTEFVVCPQDGTRLVEAGAWTDGSVVIGKYKILSRIGQGGMGSVYKAVHLAFDELRAIKVMHPNLMTDESFVKRFRHEARITRRLQHPNAVRVDDIEESEDGRPFIVMEYIEGRSLKSAIHDEGAMPVERTCSIVKQAASALDAAHQLGMIHRDIKPENIVLLGQPPHEQAKVLDFGIAKIKEGSLVEKGTMTLTGAGVVVGTPQYMSPEQAGGKRGDELDGRSDLYSLGVVMYQMLSGELPFHADTTMEMLIAHMQRPPMALQLVHPDLKIPEPVAELVMRLLEKNPNQRPATARVLIELIDEAQKARPAVNVTRIAAPAQVYSPEAAARALRESLESGAKSGTYHPAARSPVPVEPPRPAAPSPQPVVARPQPPVPLPVPAPPAKSSGWAMWALLAVVLVGAVGGGAWYFLGRQPSVTPPAQNETTTPTSTAPAQQPAQNPAASEGTAGPAAGGSEAQGKPAATQEQPTISQQAPVTSKPKRTSPPAKPAARRQETPTQVSSPGEAKPAAPAVDEKAVKAAISLGDVFYDRGDYDSAIAEYQKGLRAEPSNKVLLDKIQAAKRAKAAEERLRQ